MAAIWPAFWKIFVPGHAWLEKELQKNDLHTPKEVYLMVVDNCGGVMLIPREQFSKESGVKEG